MLLALGRLLRVSLSPSPAADVAAGLVFAGAVWPGGGGPWILIGASLCLYHGGMVLNDWADRERDAEQRPERPLPSGAIPPAAALGLALVLLAAGPLLAASVHLDAGAIAAAIALLVAAYDLRGRGALRGPLLLGLCRAANLGLGIWYGRLAACGFDRSLAGQDLEVLVAPLLLYGFYVFVVSTLGRLEDAEDPRPPGSRPARLLGIAALAMLAIPLLATPAAPAGTWTLGAGTRHLLALALGGAGAVAIARRARRSSPWTLPAIRAAMGTVLRGLLVFTAALAVLRGSSAGLVAAALILAGLPLGIVLRRAFPPS